MFIHSQDVKKFVTPMENLMNLLSSKNINREKSVDFNDLDGSIWMESGAVFIVDSENIFAFKNIDAENFSLYCKYSEKLNLEKLEKNFTKSANVDGRTWKKYVEVKNGEMVTSPSVEFPFLYVKVLLEAAEKKVQSLK